MLEEVIKTSQRREQCVMYFFIFRYRKKCYFIIDYSLYGHEKHCNIAEIKRNHDARCAKCLTGNETQSIAQGLEQNGKINEQCMYINFNAFYIAYSQFIISKRT